MKEFDETLYLQEMYRDDYFPNFLVDKIKSALEEVVEFLESGERDTVKIQEKLDAAVMKINEIAEEFYENDSEIETAARDDIARTVDHILTHFGFDDFDLEEALRERDW